MLRHDHARRGFGDYPGYHFYARRDGTLHYCRPLSVKGCHVAGHNAHSIGVCYEGGVTGPPLNETEDNRTAEQMVVLHELLTTLHLMFPQARICGHHDLNPHKPCPCLSPPPAVEYAYIFNK